jgi:hypothetical protein
MVEVGRIQPPAFRLARLVISVCTDNLNAGVAVKPAIQLDKEPAIMVREPDATMQPAPQDNQLMSKHRVLSFKPQLRLEWRGQDGQNETEQPDHSANLGDSITASTRIRFSVHTTAASMSSLRRWGSCSRRRGGITRFGK